MRHAFIILFYQQDMIFNHGITEYFELKRTFKIPCVQTPLHGQGYLHKRLIKVSSNLTLIISNDRASTTSLDNQFQRLTTLTIKYFFHMYNGNLPYSSLKLLLLVTCLANYYRPWYKTFLHLRVGNR